MKQKIEVTVLPQNFTPDEQKQARQNIGIDLANLVTSADNSLSGKLVLEDNEWVSLPDEHKYILTSTNETINITKTDNDNVTLWDVSVNSGGYKIVELDPITKEPLVENPSPLYIYLTKIEDTVGDDKYKEWVWDVNKSIWVLIGDTTIDLSDYYTIEETDKIIDDLETNVNQAISSINEDIYKIENDINDLNNNLSATKEYLEEKIAEAKDSSVLSKDIFTTTSVGYIPKGINIDAGTKIEDILTSALNQYTKPTMTVSISPSITLYDYPTTAIITGITTTISNGTETLTSVYIIDSSNVSSTSIKGFETKATITSAINIPITSNTTFTCSASDGKSLIQKSTSVNFCWPYFYGVSTVDDFNISTGTKIIEQRGDKTYSFNPVGYYWFAYDSSYPDLSSIKDNGGNGDETLSNWKKVTTTYEGHTYKMYITKEQKSAPGNFKFH